MKCRVVYTDEFDLLLSSVSSVYAANPFKSNKTTGLSETAEVYRMSAISDSRYTNKVGCQDLSRRWNIGLESAKWTLETTTQIGTQQAAHPCRDNTKRT